MLNFILPAFMQSKAVRYGLVLLALTAFYGYTYYQGFSKGKAAEATKHKLEQAEAIQAALSQQQKQLEANYQAQLQIEQKRLQNEKKHTKTQQKLDELKKDPIFSNEKFKLSKEQADSLNEIINGGEL